ncbi:MAG: hypothetical protein ABI140_05230 [Jatrophihabitantaceae bacterium]
MVIAEVHVHLVLEVAKHRCNLISAVFDVWAHVHRDRLKLLVGPDDLRTAAASGAKSDCTVSAVDEHLSDLEAHLRAGQPDNDEPSAS